jgi:hypothetical protein
MRTLKDMLAAYINETHTNWDQFVALVAHFYNTTINSATGYTPYYLMFGREDNTPDHANSSLLDNKRNSNKSYSTLAKELVTNLRIIWHQVAPKLGQRTTIFNREPLNRLKFVPYRVGDFFFRKIVPQRFIKSKDKVQYKLSSKLQFRYSGPYLVTKILSPVNYLANINGSIQPVHALNMKPHPLNGKVLQNSIKLTSEQFFNKVSISRAMMLCYNHFNDIT